RRWHCKDHSGLQCNELFREHLCLSAGQRKAIVDVKIAVLRPSSLCKSLQESSDPRFRFRIVLGEGYYHTDPPPPLALLRAPHQRPSRRAADERDEIPASHCPMPPCCPPKG